MLHMDARYKLDDVASRALTPAVTLALLAVLLVMLLMAGAGTPERDSAQPNPSHEQTITRPWI